jgi:DNA modification methylase
MTARRASAPKATNRAAKSDARPGGGIPPPKLPPYRALPVSELIAYPGNPRTHSPEQVSRIAASIEEFSFTNPILIDGRKGIIAGHGRLLAAQKLGLAVVPTIELRGLSDAQKRALILADNQLALGSGWDRDLLAGMLLDLRADGFDLALTGFDGLELDGLLGPAEGLTDPDDAPPVQAVAVSRLGDVWLMGRHRMVCGDCTDAAAVDAAMAGAKPHLMVTDPPYGVDYDPAWRSQTGVATSIRHPKKGAIGKVQNDARADWCEAWALFAGDVAYVWHGAVESHVVAESLLANGMEIRTQIIWGKHRFVIGRGHYHGHHEPCWYAVRKGATGHWQGDRTQSTLWQVDAHQKSETGHSTQKPIECMRRPIENNSAPGDAVYDPFLGSGTTLIAAEQTGRACVAIEISPQYVDVAVRRWEAFTGAVAVLEHDGRAFSAIAAERTKRAA